MEKLSVYVEIKGKKILVGSLTGGDYLETVFQYDPEYLGSSNAAPISVSMPLQKDAFSPHQTRVFFDGLLPEGFTRRSVAQWMRADAGDYLTILHGLGRECLGAIQILNEQDTDEASYEKLSMDHVHALAAEGATKSAELVTKAHLSLTGASGKVGLYYDEANGDWYLPKGSAPSTHIVKQSHVRLNAIVTNEHLALTTARKLGIVVPNCFIISMNGTEEGDVLFASERYDRKISKDSPLISGMKSPLRLHQEDFSQAMGLAANDKYEHNHAGYFKRMMDILRMYSARPLEDQLRLWDTIIFDYLVGNTDNHVKNVSLLYSEDMKSLRLAPSYDILCTSMYESSTREMGFSIGNEYLLENISRASFEKEAKNIGLGVQVAMRHFDRIASGFERALLASAEELKEKGFEQAKIISEKVLKTSGYANLS